MIDIKDNLYKKYKVSDVVGIVGFDYNIDLNEFYEKQSNIKIKFVLKDNTNILIRFRNISSLKIKNIGGEFNQILGFEIIENKTYEKRNRYHIGDYENGMIDFYCELYEIIANDYFSNNISMIVKI